MSELAVYTYLVRNHTHITAHDDGSTALSRPKKGVRNAAKKGTERCQFLLAAFRTLLAAFRTLLAAFRTLTGSVPYPYWQHSIPFWQRSVPLLAAFHTLLAAFRTLF